MQKYQKIENIVNYDAKGKMPVGFTKKYEALKGLTYFGTEKVDGTNIGIVWDGYRISFQGRTEKSELPKHLQEKLNSMFLSDEMENVFEQLFGEKEVIIFGEGYGEKIQTGGNYFSLVGDRVGFIVFDVMVEGCYLSRESVEDICNKLCLKVVPIVFEGTLEEAISYVQTMRMSRVAYENGSENEIEGIVCQPLGVRLYDERGNRICFKVKYRDVIKLKELQNEDFK